jgi:hypothetical protein
MMILKRVSKYGVIVVVALEVVEVKEKNYLN